VFIEKVEMEIRKERQNIKLYVHRSNSHNEKIPPPSEPLLLLLVIIIIVIMKTFTEHWLCGAHEGKQSTWMR
jgi:hypothetical protein